jgi:hypothetical protein
MNTMARKTKVIGYLSDNQEPKLSPPDQAKERERQLKVREEERRKKALK